MMDSATVDVVEYTDPLCSVAWGAEPKFRLLQWRHGHRISWRTVVGGLATDLSKGVDDWTREGAAKPMSAYWKRVTALTGQPYPKPMHMMLRSTDPAGRAVKAAERQGVDVGQRSLRRIRESIFLFGSGPETEEEFLVTFANLPGFDAPRWAIDFNTPEIAAAYESDWEEARQPNDYVRAYEATHVMAGVMRHSNDRDRYDFPTVLFRGPGGEHTVPGWLPYEDYTDAMEAASPGSTLDPKPDPTPVEAFERWGVLTAKELAVLCGDDAIAPNSVVSYDWGDGLAYFSAPEATAWGLNATKSARERTDLG